MKIKRVFENGTYSNTLKVGPHSIVYSKFYDAIPGDQLVVFGIRYELVER